MRSDESLAAPASAAPTALQMLLRASRLACPWCGTPLQRAPLRLRAACERCGLRVDREEGDYFLGSYTVNLMVTLFGWAGLFALAVAATWPDVPWTTIEIASVPFAIGIPIVFRPWSRTIWLAFDLAFRPARRAEVEKEAARREENSRSG